MATESSEGLRSVMQLQVCAFSGSIIPRYWSTQCLTFGRDFQWTSWNFRFLRYDRVGLTVQVSVLMLLLGCADLSEHNNYGSFLKTRSYFHIVFKSDWSSSAVLHCPSVSMVLVSFGWCWFILLCLCFVLVMPCVSGFLFIYLFIWFVFFMSCLTLLSDFSLFFLINPFLFKPHVDPPQFAPTPRLKAHF